jgi:hypothetical protein
MTPAYRFARAGNVYKELAAEDGHLIARMVRTGEIAANDDYWTLGMTEWKKVFSRSWNNLDPVATPAPTPTPTPAPAAKPPASPVAKPTLVVASPAPAREVATPMCECMACKTRFNEPAKSPSGYSVIGKAVKFFLLSIGVLIIAGVVATFTFGLATAMSSTPNWFMMVLAGIINTVLFVLALGLFLMSMFELLASSVTHGLFRFTPERCPNCNSTTFTKKA